MRYLGGMLAVFVAVEAFLVFSEMLTAAYPGAGFEADPARRLLNGPVRRLLLVRGARRPGRAVRPARRPAPARATGAGSPSASVLAVVGILIHRVNIVLNGLSYATVPYPPGVSIGTAQPAGQTSFALQLLLPRRR